MEFLISLFVLNWLFSSPEPVCPKLRPEIVSIYGMYEESPNGVQPEYRNCTEPNDDGIALCTQVIHASTTLMISKDGHIRFGYHQTGTTTDLEAIEFNKKVRQCQINNGEF